MKQTMKKLFTKTFWTYVLSFTALFLLMLAIMSVYLYKYYYDTLKRDFLASNAEYLDNIAATHENDLVFLNNVAVQTGVTEYITAFRLDEAAEKGINLKKQLRLFTTISTFFDQVYLIFDIDEYIYNHSTSDPLDRFLGRDFVLEHTTPHELYSILRDPGQLSVLPEQHITGNLRVGTTPAVLYALPVHPGNTGTLLFVVDSTVYDSLFAAAPADAHASTLLYGGRVVAARGNLPLSNALMEETLREMADGQREQTVAGEKYLFSVATGASGFRYCTVQPMQVFYGKVGSGAWRIYLFLSLLTVPATILIVLLSRRLNKPVRALLMMLRRDAGGNDFDVIKTGISELVESNQELAEQMEHSLPIRRSEVIRTFVKGMYPSREAFVAEAAAVGLALDRAYFAVAVAGSAYQMGEQPVSERLLSLFAHSAVAGYGCELVANNQTLFAIFGDSRDEIERFAAHLSGVGKSLCSSFVMAVGATHGDYAQVSSAYLEANAAFDNRFVVGEGDLLRFDDITYTDDLVSFPLGYIEALKNALRFGDVRAMNDIIDEIFRYLRASRQSLFAFRVLYNNIISVLIQSANCEQIGAGRLYDVFAMSHCMSIQDLDNTLREVCTLIMNNGGDADNVHTKMKEAAAYMQQHYEDSALNMNALADQLSISVVTLSLEFKEFMGMNPSEYLTLLRIERAKQLLRESSLSIKEVCSAVGYYSVPSFTRRFKQYTALTPMQFRLEYRVPPGFTR